MDSKQLIRARLARELKKGQKVFLGTGIPRGLAAALSEEVNFVTEVAAGAVDVAIVEAQQVSEKGDLASQEGLPQSQVARWVVATPHTDRDGEPKIVKECCFPVARRGCVELIITELGVIEIADLGLILREVAPGVAVDETKRKTAASLHVADDIKLMEM